MGFPSEEELRLASQGCLRLVLALGDLWNQVVVIGGITPTLLTGTAALEVLGEPHKGSRDVDLVLSVALVRAELYRALRQRLVDNGFKAGTNDKGNTAPARWVLEEPGEARVTVDFIMEAGPGDVVSSTQFLERDLAAYLMPHVNIAFENPIDVALEGAVRDVGLVRRQIRVCHPGPFLVLKLLAHRGRTSDREKNGKDAYDIYFILKNSYIEAISAAIGSLGPQRTREALDVLCHEFTRMQGSGPANLARYLGDGTHDDERADLVGFSQQLLRNLGHPCGPPS